MVSIQTHTAGLVTCGNSLLPFLWLLILEEDAWIHTKFLLIFDALFFFFF